MVNTINNKTAGRVEIYHPSFGWGTACGLFRWTEVEGAVVCRQLNFTGANAVVKNSNPYGAGSGPILFDNIKCTVVMNHSYGNAVTVDGMCIALCVPIIMTWVLIVTDVRTAVIDIGLEI